MNMLNTAKFLSAQKAGNNNEEQELLCLWQGRDVVNKSECLCVRWDTGGSQVAAGGGDGSAASALGFEERLPLRSCAAARAGLPAPLRSPR